MTRDELMVFYRAKLAASLRTQETCTASVKADAAASDSMLEADIAAGLEAEIAFQQAHEDEQAAAEAFRAARKKYMAELGNPVGVDAKADAPLVAAVMSAPDLRLGIPGADVPVTDEDQT